MKNPPITHLIIDTSSSNEYDDGDSDYFLVPMYAQNHDLLFVQRQLGHSDPATTAIYARTCAADGQEQLDGLEKEDD